MGKLGWRNWGEKVETGLLWLSLILGPWQLRHTWMFAQVNGGYFEYGSWQTYASEAVVVLLLIVGLILGGRRVLKPLPMKIGLPVLGALSWMTITALWSTNSPIAWLTAAHWWLVLLWCTYLVNRVKRVEQIVWPLMIGATLQAGIGIAQYIVNHSIGLNGLGESVLDPTQPGVSVIAVDGFRKLRAYGLMPHPNLLGGWLAMALASAGLITKTVTQRQWWWLGAMTVIVSVGAALSFSRIAWLAIALIILVGLGIGLKLRDKRGMALVGLMMVGLMIGLAPAHRYVATRFNWSAELERQSIEERQAGFGYWREIVSQSPNIGVGLGQYTFKLLEIAPGQGAWWYAPVHNVALLFAAELGAFGLAMWVWVVAASWQWLWQRRRQLAIWLAGLPLLVWLVLGATDHWPVSLEQGQILFFLALALIILASRRIMGTEQED